MKKILCYPTEKTLGGILMDSDGILLGKHYIELAEKAYRREIYTFTDFLGLAEQDLFSGIERQIAHVPHRLYGGMEGCERVMVRFGDEDLCGYDAPFPIACVQAQPLSRKFADKLTHRDFLGALMNLGIAHSLLGDIVLRDNTAYIFCTEKIAPFLCSELTRAKHTSLACTITDALPKGTLLSLESRECLVSSERADGITAHLYHLSRSEMLEYIRAGKLFVNGRRCVSGSQILTSGDVVSLRGTGRFIYRGIARATKSGRLCVAIDIYV